MVHDLFSLIPVILNLPESDVWLKGDGHRISQILINLISNAVKFTDEGLITLSMGFEPLNAAETLVRFTIKRYWIRNDF